jgi:hypothetical protein
VSAKVDDWLLEITRTQNKMNCAQKLLCLLAVFFSHRQLSSTHTAFSNVYIVCMESGELLLAEGCIALRNYDGQWPIKKWRLRAIEKCVELLFI